jgi:hypothetical protein
MVEKQIYWMGVVGDTDDFGKPYVDEMIDGKTKMGPWACMTPGSWLLHGVRKLGTGFGQKYSRQPTCRWLKVEG